MPVPTATCRPSCRLLSPSLSPLSPYRPAYRPYDPAEIERASSIISGLPSASPADLSAEDGPAPWKFVLRRADLLDLFDTSPDLSGNEIDISRFIRSGDERDVYVAWRQLPKLDPAAGKGAARLAPETDIADAELCPVPIGEFKQFAKKLDAFRWNFTTDRWEHADLEKLYPGLELVMDVSAGGYTATEGWSPGSKAPVPAVVVKREDTSEPEGDSSDSRSFTKRELLAEHTDAVLREMGSLLKGLSHTGIVDWERELIRAAELHDWGKAHDIMQKTLRGGEQTKDILGKSAHRGRHSVPHFRHELASAFAMVQSGEPDLCAYLAAAHHGRVRVSVRSLPGEKDDRIRGIREGDQLPACLHSRKLLNSLAPHV